MADQSELNKQLAALVNRCAQADKHAFAELYDLTSPKLLAIQVRILGMTPMAERALQETFSRIWLKAREYGQDSGQAMPWMTSIARNHALNLRRALNESKAVESPHDETGEISAELADTAFLENNAEARPLVAALNQLDDQTRVSIVTAYLDGLSLKELSEVYNMPIMNVHAAVHAGMLSVRGSLNASG